MYAPMPICQALAFENRDAAYQIKAAAGAV